MRCLVGVSICAIGVLMPGGLVPLRAEPVQAVRPSFAEQTRQFDIAAGDLSAALMAWAKVSNLRVLAPTKLVGHLQTRGVVGAFTSEQALRRLLEGTTLSYQLTGGQHVTIYSARAVSDSFAQALELDPINVEAANPSGVVGYVATRSAAGTKTNTPLIETPASVSVVTRRQLTDQQARTVQEAVRYVAGVRTEATGAQSESDSSLQIRGFDQGSSNLFVDGMRLSSTSYLGSFTPELYGIERVEVLRGPASILYGQNSPGGMINLVTKRPTDVPFHEIEVQGGSFGRKQAAIDLSGPVDPAKQVAYRFTALANDGDTQIDSIPDRKLFAAGAVTWRPTSSTEITLLADHQKRDTVFAAGLPSSGTVQWNPNGRIPTNRFLGEPGFDDYNVAKTSVGYLAEHRIGDVWTFRQNLRYSHFETDSRSLVSTGLVGSNPNVNRRALVRQTNADVLTVDNQAQARFATGPIQHTVLAGLDYQNAQIFRMDGNAPVNAPLNIFNPVYGQRFTTPAFTSGTDQDAANTGLYIQDQIKFDQRWVLLVGGRHDRATSTTTNIFTKAVTSKDDEAFSKRAGLVYLSDIGLAPYVSYAESFEPQTGTDRFNNPFKPTTGQQNEAGIKYQPVGYNSFITVAAFDLRRQNVTTTDPVNSMYSIQTGEIQVRGVEFEAKASLNDSFDLVATATRQDARITRSNGADLGKIPTRVPSTMASMWLTYTVGNGAWSGLRVGGGARYIGDTFGDTLNSFRVPGFTVFDAMVSYDFGQFRVALNAINLFDKEHVTGCNSTNNCGYGVRRTITASLRYRW